MTNTQSPAPGVAAEAQIDALLKLADDYVLYSGRPYSLSVTAEKRIALESALRTALQASAAAVPAAWLRLDPVDAITAKKKAELEQFNGKPGKKIALQYTEPLYTAPPLPAQVQAAEVTDALILEALAEQDVFLIHHQPGEDDRIPESGMFSDVTPADMRKAFAYIASRTPAPGMAGGVGAEPICSESGYLCYAYGEDSRVARLCHTREEVLQFMLREWFGDESPEKMHPDTRENWDTAVAEFDAPEWDLGDQLVWELEQGGVTIDKVCFYPAPATQSKNIGDALGAPLENTRISGTDGAGSSGGERFDSGRQDEGSTPSVTTNYAPHPSPAPQAAGADTEETWEHKPQPDVGPWTHSGDSGYCSRPFWVVHRYNPKNMFSTEYLNTRTGRKRFYSEDKAIAEVAKLNAAITASGRDAS